LVEPLLRFGIFPKLQPSAVLRLLHMCLVHPQRVFGGLYHCAKFGFNHGGNFDNMQVSIFC